MSDSTGEMIFRVRGMDCAGCARSIESGVAQLAGVESAELSFTSERLRVRGPVARAAVERRVRDLGYELAEEPAPVAPALQPDPAAAGFLRFMWARAETRLALLGALLILPGVVLHELLGVEALWLDALAVGALLAAGLPVARSAWRAVTVSRELNINVLMTIAAVGALLIGATVEAGLVMVLFAVGEALEGYTGARARQAVRSLMELTPETATRLGTSCCGDGCETRVPVAELVAGDRILVRPGERLAVDGTVLSGESWVNQAPITGESRPVEKAPGAEVLAGSVNGEGALEVAVSRPAAESTISRMVRLVAEAQERRAPVERFVDRFARWYTPLVVLVAALTAALPPLLFGQPLLDPAPGEHGWLYRGLALLVVACPCALVISTPVSLVSALSAAARAGVLIKGGAHLETLARVRALAFDKTGTLTTGRPAVVAVRALACTNGGEGAAPCAACDELLALAHAVERRSEHPLAHAIVTASAERGLSERYPAAQAVTAMAGRGVRGEVAGREVLVGSHRAFDAGIPHAEEHCAAATRDAGLGRTPLLVSAAGSYLGTISVADRLRPSAPAAVARLKALGLRAVAMLTGDEPAAAAPVAAAAGVSELRAGLLPEQKVAAVEELKRQHGAVAMVGDGINDTPALAAASVGVAVGAAHGGTSQAMETADITLMSDDLGRLPYAIGLARAAMRTVGFNIALSVGVKLIFLAVVLAGAGTLWMAVLADVGTSLLVTLNGMRLLGYRERG